MTYTINDGKITMTLSAEEAMNLRSTMEKCAGLIVRSNDPVYAALSAFAVEIHNEAGDVQSSWDDEQTFEEESK